MSDLNKIPWYEIILSDDVNEKLLHFNEAFFQVLENHAPIKEIKIKHRRCPFINEEIKEKMAKRDQAHKIARETGALVDWQYYRDCRNDVKTVLREAEKEYVQNEIKKNQSSSERWKVIRNCIPTRERSRPAYSRDMKELATEFNEFFTEVGVRAAEQAKRLASVNGLPTSHQEIPVSFIPEEDEFQFRAATSFEINRIVQSFPSNKAPGKDKLHMAVVKDALPAILPTLTEIINSSLLTSVFPSLWKESEIVPILKDGGDPEVANENRPVSLLPALSKICERVALNQFTEYATRRNCLSGHQSGNKKRHSTETLNILTSDLALEAMDRKQVTALVLLDLSKAFDSIDHMSLLKKLRAMGTSKEAIEWFRSYLTGRKQSVRIGCETSEPRLISYGVPQGSILGPALFNIYINDLPSVPKVGSLECYVDDSQLYLSFPVRDTTLAADQLTEDLRNIAAWCCKNSLLINPDKTKLLVLGTPQMLMKIPDDLSITLLSKKIIPSKSAKNLGVTMDCSLTYDEHVTQVTSKCIGSLCQINRVKYLFDRRTLITIINSLVFSKLFYCSSVWANTTKKNIELLQTVQNFAARIVSGTRKFDHVTPILKQLQWLPIIKQLAVRDATMVFKCLNGLAPPYLCQRFKTRSEVHNCNTRNRDRLHIPLRRTAAGQRAFTFRGQKLWNSLPDEFQSITNLDVFKVKIKQHFLRVFLEN